MNKRIPKIFVSISSAGLTPAVAIASSVSFASTAKQAAKLTFDQYLSQINDKSTDDTNVTLWNNDAKAKFLGSNFYKEIVGKNNDVWNIEGEADINSHISTLYDSTEFNDAEKVSIAKYIINNEVFDDFFNNFGFDTTIGKEITQAQIVAAGVGKTLVDPSKLVATPLKYNSSSVPLMGLTGINKDWQGNDAHDSQLNISNQTAISYFTAIVAHSPELTTMSNSMSTLITEVVTKSITLKQALTAVWNNTNSFLSNFATTKTPVTELLKFSTFNFLQTFEMSDIDTNDDVYSRCLLSDLGKALFTPDQIALMKATWDATTSDAMKSIYMSEILSQIAQHLTGFINASSPELNNAVYNGSETNKFNDSNFNDSISTFAKFLLDYSNSFSNDIQIRAVSDISIKGYGLEIKSGHVVGDWNLFSESDLKLPYWIASDSVRNLKMGYGNVKSTFKNEGFNATIVNDGYTSYDLTGVLWPESKAVMYSGDARNFKIDLQLTKSSTTKTNALQLWENDHADDGAVKHSDWLAKIVSNAGFTWSGYTDNSTITSGLINFYYDKQNDATSDATIDFKQIVDKINEAVTKAKNAISADIVRYQDGSGPSWFNPTKLHTFILKLDSINFGKTYFNTYDDSGWDDTHVNNFRFDDVKANFSYQIIEMV